MSLHKYWLGQKVHYAGGHPMWRDRASPVYTITRLLPLSDRGFSYRIRGENEPHERMAEEGQLQAVE